MTDKELLENAAKAMGYKYMNGALWDGRDVVEYLWHPQDDDGQAMRLAVKLKMDVIFDFDRVVVCFGASDEFVTEYFYLLPEPTDTYAATRRAIVRAAVVIGKL
jgi:hypothetical protein